MVLLAFVRLNAKVEANRERPDDPSEEEEIEHGASGQATSMMKFGRKCD
jgi:hypothetical protein